MSTQVILRTKEQSNMIHSLVSKINTTTEKSWYRKELKMRYGVDSSKDLTYQEAEDFIEILTNRAVSLGVWEYKEIYYKKEEREGKATLKQMNMIRAMYWKIYPAYVEMRIMQGRDFERDRNKALRKLLKSKMGVEALKWLDKEKVSDFKCILESIKKQNINTVDKLKMNKEREAMIVNG